MITITVAPGDTLSSIAASHGDSLAAVEAANPNISNPDLIFTGQQVVIPEGGSFNSWTPASSTTAGAATSASPSSTPSNASGGGLSDVPGVPSSFAACVAYRESSNGTNQAYNGGVYGIITASGYNVNGQSLAAQKQAFSALYRQYGGAPWAADGCPGT